MMAMVGEAGSGILAWVLWLVILIAPAYAVDRIFRYRDVDDRRSCLLMGLTYLALAAALYALFGTSITILQSNSCRSSNDWQACMGREPT